LDQRAYAQPAALLPRRDRCGQHSGSSRRLHWCQHYHLGGSQCRWRRLRKSYAYGESIGHVDADSYTNCDGNRYAYADSDSDGNCHIHSDSDRDSNRNLYANSDSNCHGYGDGNSNVYANSNCHSDGDSDTNCDPTAAALTDAKASSNTAAPAVRPVACSLVWELAR
jgi:hypothetical protein